MRKKSASILLILISSLLFASGCAQQTMYYWGDYSKSLYAYRKDENEESLLKHKQALEKIIEESQKRSLRIPPGVSAELGYIYFTSSNYEEAIRYFRMEEQLYPESKTLMQRLMMAAETRKTANSGTKTKAELHQDKRITETVTQ